MHLFFLLHFIFAALMNLEVLLPDLPNDPRCFKNSGWHPTLSQPEQIHLSGLHGGAPFIVTSL